MKDESLNTMADEAIVMILKGCIVLYSDRLMDRQTSKGTDIYVTF